MHVIRIKVWVVLAMLCACQGSWANDIQRARAEAIERHSALAISYQQSNELARALREWRIVNAIDPASSEVKKRIKKLESDIRKTSRILLKHANAAFDDGDEYHAKRIYLAILALEPQNEVARNAVQLIEGGEKLADLSDKTATPIASSPGDAEPVQIESISIIRRKGEDDPNASSRTNESEQSGTATMTPSQTLAERHFRQGVELFLHDRPAAIAEFERVLELNPDHVLARRYRSTALKLQQY